VRHSERNAHKPSTATGLFACLRAFPGVKGSAAPSTARRRRFALLGALPLAFLATLTVLVVVPASASAETECEKYAKEGLGFRGGFEYPDPAHPVKRTLTSVVLGGQIIDHGCETKWSIGWSKDPGGPWSPFPGGSGTVPGVEGTGTSFETGELTGLEPEKTYYDLGTLESVLGVNNKEGPGTFETKLLRPSGVAAFPSSIGETSVRVEGNIEPAPFETQWRIEYAPTEGGHAPAENSPSWTLLAKGVISQAEAEALQTATGANVAHPEAELTGLSPSSLYYVRTVAEDEPEWPPLSTEKHHKEVTSQPNGFETHGPPVAEAFATPALRLETLRVLGDVAPHGFDTHYHFEYGLTVAYGSTTPVEDAGSGGTLGTEASVVGADLPGLQAGETYHYRLVASSPAAGGVTVHGSDHALTVPVPAEGSVPAACSNQAFRTGASANLPACRAYEQVTPVNKESAMEPFNYAEKLEEPGGLVGEDGNHFILEAPFTKWGSSQSPYFFSREEGKDWRMTAGQVQPEAGINRYRPELFSPDLTSFAFTAAWATSTEGQSPSIELRAGVPGGPYATVASVPREQLGESTQSGWVAASPDFSKLILRVEDRAVVPGHPSSTSSGSDLYEDSRGELRQVNVLTGGATVGACGATMAKGPAEGAVQTATSTRHAISPDGSRVFFSAVPGTACSEALHLYMRVNGGEPNAETVDIGPYNFLAANAAGTEVLLEARSGETEEVLLYHTATATTERLVTLHEHLNGADQLHLTVSEDFSTIYLESTTRLTPEAPPILGGEYSSHFTDLYRYDIAAKALHFVVQAQFPHEFTVTPDGRYAYWRGMVPGLPSGSSREGEAAILYDSVQNVVECVSCASPFNPEPKQDVAAQYWGGSGLVTTRDGTPKLTVLSADGSRVFFDTPAALLPSDIDGEVEPGSVLGSGTGTGTWWSPSSDVYEWRRNGIEGCAHVQGCLSLVSSGRGGYLVMLMGADASGRNVFFTTRESLAPQDTDTAIDVYDARIGGGFPPPPPKPTECQGDACSTPFAAPSDRTPSSSTFQGAGNLSLQPPPAPVKKTAAQIRAEKLAKALTACHRRYSKSKKRRAACEKQARRAYGPAPKAKKSRKGGRS
jgi:hypothetical protein